MSTSIKTQIITTAKAIRNGVGSVSNIVLTTTERANGALGQVSNFMTSVKDVAPAAIAITAVAATAVAAPPIAVLIASIAIIAKNVKETYDLNEDLKNLIGEAQEMANTAHKIVTDQNNPKFSNIYTHIMNLFVTCNYLDLRYKTRSGRVRGFVFFPQDYLDEITQQLTLLNSAILVIIINDPGILNRHSESKSNTTNQEAEAANDNIQTILNPLFTTGTDNVAIFQNMGLTPESFSVIKNSTGNASKSESVQPSEILSADFLRAMKVQVIDTTYSVLHKGGGWTKRNRRTKYRKPRKMRKMRKTKKPIFLIQKRKTHRATKSTKINIKKR